MNCEYVRQHYRVPAEIGRRIDFNGRSGVIAEDHGNYIGVLFDDANPNNIVSIHPKEDGLTYGEMGKVRKMTTSQRRYRDFMEADWFVGTFEDWIKRYHAYHAPF